MFSGPIPAEASFSTATTVPVEKLDLRKLVEKSTR
jgi:hypothetical protein